MGKEGEKKEYIADFQIHSRYARACSKNTTLDLLEKYGRIKGVDILGTGDFQHPGWNKEIKEKLKEDDKGILWSKTGFPFIWQTEVSLMFSSVDKKGEKKRRAVHLLIFAPNRVVADKIIGYLGSKGRLDYDGRPIFGMSCEQLVKDLKEIDDLIEIIPAHCLLPGEKVICNSGVKEISDMEEGDKVLTHKGHYQTVKEVLAMPYEGDIYTITPYYFREFPLTVTSKHPILSIKTVKDCSFV